MESKNNIVIDNVEKLRKQRGQTQEQLAKYLRMSRGTYINIIQGRREFTVSELEKAAQWFGVPINELFNTPRNIEKFKHMYFYILSHFKNGIPKTKLAKLLYLSDFTWFYMNLESMSGVTYIRRQYGPVADIFLDLTDDFFENGKIHIESLEYVHMISSRSTYDYGLLSDDEKKLIDRICEYWKEKPTKEIINFTHEQGPWQCYRDREPISYASIIQEDPDHVFAPIALWG